MNQPYRPDAPVHFPPTPDENNLRVLAIFHYVAAGFMALFSCMFIVYIAMGVMMMTGKGLAPAPGAPSAAPVGIVLVCLGSAAVAFGWTMAAFMVVVGRSLTARKRHLLCVVVAALECLWMPFGTILGIFTLLLIMKPHVRALFVVGTPAR